MSAETPASGEEDAVSPENWENTSLTPKLHQATSATSTLIHLLRMEQGVIRDADCSAPNRVTIRFETSTETLNLSLADLANTTFRLAGKDISANSLPCSQWKGRKARITFRPASGPGVNGSILAIEFF